MKRIIKADKELDMMTSEASFMVAVATVGEAFPRYLVQVEVGGVLTVGIGVLYQAIHGGGVYQGEVG